MNKILNYLVRLVPVFYKRLDSSIKGRSKGLWIEIRPEFKDDKGLLAHERVHVRQLLRIWLAFVIVGIVIGFYINLNLGLIVGIFGFLVHGLLYTYSKAYKYKAEVEAFGYSVLYGNRSKDNVRRSLKSYYKIPDSIMTDFEKDFEKSMNNAKADLKELSK